VGISNGDAGYGALGHVLDSAMLIITCTSSIADRGMECFELTWNVDYLVSWMDLRVCEWEKREVEDF